MNTILFLLLISLTSVFCENMQLYTLDKELYPEAKCLDGSQAGFYYQ